jgi:adenosine deaminase
METGLEVCINTDNRTLNRPFDDGSDEFNKPDADPRSMSLTDEYMRAARLSGGLTRWEVLKLVRAGFKHAFLHRDEIAALLSSVEAQLFPMVGQDPGTTYLSGYVDQQEVP